VTKSRADVIAVPEGVGAPSWDGMLPPWPEGGKLFEVGPGRAFKTIGTAMFLARDGDRVIVYGGHYHGQVRLDRRVWLDAREGAQFMGHDGSAVVITAPGARVTGLTITHAGDSMDAEDAGVTVKDAPGAVVAGMTISDVKFGVVAKNSPGVLIAGNEITGRDEELSLVGDGIRVWFSDGARVQANTVRHTREILIEQTRQAVVTDNAVTDCRQGLHLMSAPEVTAARNFLASNSTGIYVMYGAGTRVVDNWVAHSRGPSGYGVGIKEADGVTVTGNRLVSNRVGIYIENAPRDPERPGTLTRNLLAGNDLGISLTTATHSNQVSENDFIENLQQVSASAQGALAANRWSVNGRGNHWSDYAGYDAGSDGLGDVAYAPLNVFEGWMDRQPALRWFWFTPASSAVDAAAQAFPIAAPEPLLTDEHPLVKPSTRGESRWSSLTGSP
jgi:nitrous oxidase accessory protein